MRRAPCAASRRSWWKTNGSPATGTSALGMPRAISPRRVARPPRRTATGRSAGRCASAGGMARVGLLDAPPGVERGLEVAGERTVVGGVDRLGELLPLPTPRLVVGRELGRLHGGRAQLRSHGVDDESLCAVRARETLDLELRSPTEDLE